MDISIVIFCYNEADNLEPLINFCFEIIPRISGSFEVIVVNDGSNDNTPQILSGLGKKHTQLKTITHATNMGIGMALLSGYIAASKEYICAVPGDGQFDIRELLTIKPFSRKNFYSFYRPETNYNVYRRFLTVSNKIFNRVFLGLRLKDVNWVKVYRKDQLGFLDLKMKSAIVESEICAKLIKSECEPVEISSAYHKRENGEPKGGSWKTLSKVIKELLALIWVVNRFKPAAFTKN